MKKNTLIKRKRGGYGYRLPHRRLIFIFGFLLFVFILFVGFHFGGAQNDLQNTAEWALALRQAPLEDKGANYLIYGVYGEDGEARIEDIFFLNCPAGTDRPHIIFIPGELLMSYPAEQKNGFLSTEQEEAENDMPTFFYPVNLYEEGGSRLLINRLSYFLGVPIHYYLGINYEGIPQMVDYLGGIAYRGYVLKGDDYYDYFLKGEEEESPRQRALRRMQMLDQLVKYAGEKRGLFRNSRSLRKAVPYLDTNISWKELQALYPSLASLYGGMESEITMLPGTWRQQVDGEYYYEPERGLISYLMANLGQDFILPRQLITVEVLNGSGVSGIAARVAEMLKKQGFQVVNVDNADSFDYARSQVISRQAEMGPAKAVAEILGAELLKEEVPGFPAMVTVIVGKNFSPE